MESDNCYQGIFTYLLIYIFISKALRKERPSTFPKSRTPMEIDAHSRALTYLSGSPVKEPSLQVPLMESPQTEMPPSFIIQSPQDMSALPYTKLPLDLKQLLWREMPVTGAFINISSRVPSKGALPRGPLH